MSKPGMFAAAIAVLAVTAWSQSALADTAAATCEVRKEGEKKQGASGACDFSERQGYISINLRNGDNVELRPADKANHFKDQKGNKVVRTATGANTQEYRWDHRKVIVTFATGYGTQGHTQHHESGGTPADLQDLVGAKGGQAEGELQRRGYEYRAGSTSGHEKNSYWLNQSSGRCVQIVTAEGRYRSIVNSSAHNCSR